MTTDGPGVAYAGHLGYDTLELVSIAGNNFIDLPSDVTDELLAFLKSRADLIGAIGFSAGCPMTIWLSRLVHFPVLVLCGPIAHRDAGLDRRLGRYKSGLESMFWPDSTQPILCRRLAVLYDPHTPDILHAESLLKLHGTHTRTTFPLNHYGHGVARVLDELGLGSALFGLLCNEAWEGEVHKILASRARRHRSATYLAELAERALARGRPKVAEHCVSLMYQKHATELQIFDVQEVQQATHRRAMMLRLNLRLAQGDHADVSDFVNSSVFPDIAGMADSKDHIPTTLALRMIRRLMEHGYSASAQVIHQQLAHRRLNDRQKEVLGMLFGNS